MTESGDQTVTYDIGFKRPPKHAQRQKDVSVNPYGRKVERHSAESIFHRIPFSVVAPSRERHRPTCTNSKAMVRAVVSKAIEGDVAAFREVMEWARKLGMESPFETRKLSLEFQNHPLEAPKSQCVANAPVEEQALLSRGGGSPGVDQALENAVRAVVQAPCGFETWRSVPLLKVSSPVVTLTTYRGRAIEWSARLAGDNCFHSTDVDGLPDSRGSSGTRSVVLREIHA